MIHITGPAVVIGIIVAYLGMDAIVHFVGNLFEKDREKQDEEKQK